MTIIASCDPLFGEQDRQRNRALQGVVAPRPVFTLWDTTIPTSGIWGMDVAGIYDGVPNYAQFLARGGQFVVIKAADGTLRGNRFDENVAAARAAGVPVVCGYFWLYRTARISASAQASAWWNIVQGKGLNKFFVDYEWTSWNGQADNPQYSDLKAALDAFQNISGIRPEVYSAPGYLAQYPVREEIDWIAHYRVSAPARACVVWQCSETWPGRELGVSEANAVDGDIFMGTASAFESYFGAGAVEPEPEPVEPPIVIRRALADYDLCTTATSGVLPLKSALEHAQANGWEVCMNGGAGFDYPQTYDPDNPDPAALEYDKTHGIPRTEGELYFTWNGQRFYYVRPAVVGGVVPAANRNPDFEPWCILAKSATEWIFILTVGTGMNEQAACQYALSVGAVDAWVLDSDRSAQAAENGVMRYWPFGDEYAAAHPPYTAERVPVAIGLRKKGSGTVAITYKGTGRAGTSSNIKTLAGVLTNLALTGGDYVYGEKSQTGSDIINFDHFYRASGARVDIGKGLCKVTTANMVQPIPQATEPGTTPPPVTGVPHMKQLLTDDDGVVWLFECDGVKQS